MKSILKIHGFLWNFKNFFFQRIILKYLQFYCMFFLAIFFFNIRLSTYTIKHKPETTYLFFSEICKNKNKQNQTQTPPKTQASFLPISAEIQLQIWQTFTRDWQLQKLALLQAIWRAALSRSQSGGATSADAGYWLVPSPLHQSVERHSWDYSKACAQKHQPSWWKGGWRSLFICYRRIASRLT